jgi:hypothetical protein
MLRALVLVAALPFAAVARDRRLLPATLALQAFAIGNVLPRLLSH